MLKKIIFFAIFFGFTLNLTANVISPLYDFWYVITSPVSVEKNNLLKVGIFTGITFNLFLVDEKIQNWVQKNKSNAFDFYLKYPEKMGDGKYLLATSTILILVGEISKERKLTKLGIYSAESFFISGMIVSITKIIFGRARPYTEKGAFYYKPFNFKIKTSYTSFYSGHTTVAFAFASSVSSFTKNIYLSTILYTTASFTALARVYHNKHWTSDVFFGAVTGILIGKKVVELNEIKFKDENQDQIKFVLWRKDF